MGIVVRSMGLLHLHLSAVAPGHFRAALRAAAGAPLHLPPTELHAQDVHLAQSCWVFPLLLHLISMKLEALPFWEHLPAFHAHCEPVAVHEEFVVNLLQQRS